MISRIGSDVDRFKQIVKNKVKHNLGKYVSSDKLIGQQGNKKISIPLDFIDLPRFTFGSGQGGTSQGPEYKFKQKNINSSLIYR